MTLADQIIEKGPYEQDLLVGQGFSAPLWWWRAADLNELRDELIAARQARTDMQRFQVEPAYDGSPWIALHCDRCRWHAEIGRRAHGGLPVSEPDGPISHGVGGCTGCAELRKQATFWRDQHDFAMRICADLADLNDYDQQLAKLRAKFAEEEVRRQQAERQVDALTYRLQVATGAEA